MAQITIDVPAGAVQDVHIATPSAGGGVAAAKLICHKSKDDELFATATTVAAVTRVCHIFNGSQNGFISFAAILQTVPTSSDTVTVDLKKSTGGGSYATVLSSTIVFNSSSVARVRQLGVFSATTAAQGDSFEVVVTVSGSSAAGLAVTTEYWESYA